MVAPAFYGAYPEDVERMRKKMIRARNGMIAGYVVFGGMYLVSAIVGVFQLQSANTQQGQFMLIPLAGPWLAMAWADTDGGAIAYGFVGGLQGLAFVGGVAGMTLFLNRRLRLREMKASVAPVPGGGTVGLRWSF